MSSIFSIILPLSTIRKKKKIYNKQSANDAVKTTVSTLKSLRQNYDMNYQEIYLKARTG